MSSIPGPSLPAAVQMYRWIRDPHGFLSECREQYGDTFHLRMAGFGDSIFSADPAFAHAVFTADPDTLRAGEGNDVLLPFVGKHSLLTMDGPPHRRDRKLMTPPFHGARMRAYGEIVGEAARRALAAWPTNGEVQSHPAMQHTSLEVILRAVFGVQQGEELHAASHSITAVLESVTGPMMFVPLLRANLGPYSPGGRYKARKIAADAMMAGAIRQRRESPGEDILSLLLAARDEGGNALTDAELHDELTTLLLAGHETTATALAWCLTWLAATPTALASANEEVRASGADPEVVAKLPYLEAVCHEALRVVPVFPIVMRVASRDWDGPVPVPSGWRVAPCIYLVHQRPDLYPDPHLFRPERFLERTYSAAEYFPFGGGARRCIGQAFALYEMKIVLATVLRSFDLMAGQAPPVAMRRNIAMAPKGGAQVHVRRLG